MTDEKLDKLLDDYAWVVSDGGAGVEESKKIQKHFQACERRAGEKGVALALLEVRDTYDQMEHDKRVPMKENGEVDMWRCWKMIRNVVTDRVEKITGSRNPDRAALKGKDLTDK